MIATEHDLEAFIKDFEELTLPKRRWTHQAHLVVALWYLTRHTPDDALEITRRRIRAYNEAVGTPNSDSGGYHETLTRLFLRGVAAHLSRHGGDLSLASIAVLLASPLANKDWPLQFCSRERLFSVDARRHWVEPDHASEKLDGSV